VVHKDILFYSIFSCAFMKRAKLRGSFRKNACIRWDGKQNYKGRIWNFIWHTNFNFIVPSLLMYFRPWQIGVWLCTGEPVFLFRLLVWDCTNHSEYCCSPNVFYSKFTPRSFPWVGKGYVTWRWPDTANFGTAYTDTSTCTTLFLGLVLQLNKDFTYTFT
jgi:hypothetical protein